MRLVIRGRETQYDPIFADRAFTTLVEEAHLYRPLLEFLASVVRSYLTLNDIRRGLAKGSPPLRLVAQKYGRSRQERAAVRRAVSLLDDLYGRYPPSDVRGVLLEGLVEQRLRGRYGDGGHQLENNARFALENSVAYSTGEKSIDVIGFDGYVGECHDCKARASRVEKSWTDQLVRYVAPHGFRIGIVTADSRVFARQALQRKGVNVLKAVPISPEDWWQLTPLQPPLG